MPMDMIDPEGQPANMPRMPNMPNLPGGADPASQAAYEQFLSKM
jgi:hypothetical protein